MVQAGSLELRDVGKGYQVDGRHLQVIEGVSLTVAAGEFVSIVGPSGCGKSTLLRLIVGLDPDYHGEIRLGGEPISGPSLERGIVFQDHRLLPWLTVVENIALGVENRPWSKQQKRQAVQDHIDLVGLTGFEAVYPHQLSGGMAQRAAIARGLAGRPELLLLDEPLGALDALTRMRLQDELRRIWQTERVTMILVTHDVEEAVYLSDRVIVMQPGRIANQTTVDLPQPRDRASYRFADTRRRILEQMGALEPAGLASGPRLQAVG